MKARTHGPDRFAHPALFYSGVDQYLAATLPFIRAGLDADEAVLVAAPADNLDLIRRALGDDAGRVELHDMAVPGRNPGRINPQLLLAFTAAHEGQLVRIIGEPIWHGRTASEYLALCPTRGARQLSLRRPPRDDRLPIRHAADGSGLDRGRPPNPSRGLDGFPPFSKSKLRRPGIYRRQVQPTAVATTGARRDD
ncbi:hypothetical protein Afe04nite_82180 [Asanoa ferruginea]|nr:hypothetical protein Afe04nite_82180 [Asanoa ferruginea]